jgi:hypothetical protein
MVVKKAADRALQVPPHHFDRGKRFYVGWVVGWWSESQRLQLFITQFQLGQFGLAGLNGATLLKTRRRALLLLPSVLTAAPVCFVSSFHFSCPSKGISQSQL